MNSHTREPQPANYCKSISDGCSTAVRAGGSKPDQLSRASLQKNPFKRTTTLSVADQRHPLILFSYRTTQKLPNARDEGVVAHCSSSGALMLTRLRSYSLYIRALGPTGIVEVATFMCYCFVLSNKGWPSYAQPG